jgi:EmrB/QacA subfamily drug resistance transporter
VGLRHSGTHSIEEEYSETKVLALLATVVFIAVINGTMINVALPYIGDDFGVTEGVYGWIVTGYVVAFGVFNAINGRLADILGVRRLYLAAIAVLGLASLLIAVSPSIELIIAIRVLQGAGAAGLPVMGTTIISRLIPARNRGAAMGVIMSTVGFAASLGPFFGGAIVQFFDWRVVFALVGTVLLAIPAVIRILPKSLDEVGDRSFDTIGAVLMGAGVALLIYGFNVVQDSGFGTWFLGTTGSGVVLLVAFALWIQRAADPFATPEMFKNGQYVSTLAQAFAANGARFGTVVLIPIFLKEVNQVEAIWAGVVLFPGAMAIGFLSRRAGDIADRIGPLKPVAIGTAILLVGNLTTTYYAGGNIWGVTVGMTLVGLGYAFVQPPLLSTASQVLPDRDTSGGMGIFMMVLFVGGATGVAVAVTVAELQPDHVTSWLGLPVASPRYSNAALVLACLGCVGMGMIPFLPNAPLDEG